MFTALHPLKIFVLNASPFEVLIHEHQIVARSLERSDLGKPCSCNQKRLIVPSEFATES